MIGKPIIRSPSHMMQFAAVFKLKACSRRALPYRGHQVSNDDSLADLQPDRAQRNPGAAVPDFAVLNPGYN